MNENKKSKYKVSSCISFRKIKMVTGLSITKICNELGINHSNFTNGRCKKELYDDVYQYIRRLYSEIFEFDQPIYVLDPKTNKLSVVEMYEVDEKTTDDFDSEEEEKEYKKQMKKIEDEIKGLEGI